MKTVFFCILLACVHVSNAYRSVGNVERSWRSLMVVKSANQTFDLRHKDAYVILYVFSGRKAYESIFVEYLKSMLDHRMVDEVHLSIIQQKTKQEDVDWLQSLASAYRIDQYDGGWDKVYDYYASDDWKPPEGKEDKTIFVKADDDIVYVDVAHFNDYVKYTLDHKEMFLVFANTINNGVAAFYQQQHGAIPQTVNGTDMSMPYPPDGFGGKLWEDKNHEAVVLHKLFLQNPSSFSWHDTENDGCIVYHAPNSSEQARFSINFFAYRAERRKKIASMVRLNSGEDEDALTSRNTAKSCMFTSFLVSHFSFSPQRRDVDASHIIDEYRAFKNKMLANLAHR